MHLRVFKEHRILCSSIVILDEEGCYIVLETGPAVIKSFDTIYKLYL